jgi:hypothetical protein
MEMLKVFAACIALALGVSACYAQEPEKPSTSPTAVEWTISAAAGPVQRTAIKSVFLLLCTKTQMKGTGFLLNNGLIVTNNHVVEGCTKDEMFADPWSQADVFGFTKMVTDKGRDLALLHPAKHLTGGLELASAADQDPLIETSVETWGFPLNYNGPAPLLSVGYVAGYVKDGEDGKEVKHVVVNGAFNPGNSGGPLLRNKDNKVIGIVVAKVKLYPPFVENMIKGLSQSGSGMMHGLLDDHGNPILDEKGQPKMVSEAQILAAILDQFYKTSQVMIGEAISVSELRAFIKDKQSEVQ